MRFRSRAVTAVVAGLLLLAPSAAPAAADSVTTAVTSGTIAAYRSFETTPTFDLSIGETGASCTTSGSITAAGGDVTITIVDVSAWIIPFISGNLVTLTVTLSGTYTGDSIALTAGTATAVATQLTGSCTGDAGTTCTMAMSDFAGGADVTIGTLPTLTSGDTVSVSASNADFSTSVTGPDCGGLHAIDNGRVEIAADLEVV